MVLLYLLLFFPDYLFCKNNIFLLCILYTFINTSRVTPTCRSYLFTYMPPLS